METKNVIYELRTGKGMSQDELAEKLFVTRQAVSRWENGETVPNTVTLKLLKRLFDVSIISLRHERPVPYPCILLKQKVNPLAFAQRLAINPLSFMIPLSSIFPMDFLMNLNM